jgi:alpha-tubulin suppressor-like RCC1 family protein
MNFLSFATTIAAGNYHSLFLDTEGNVWATGSNKDGQLGLGDNVNNVQVSTKIDTLPAIKAVAARNNHSLFLDNEGNVWATGCNNYGRLGLGDNTVRTVPTKIDNMPPIKTIVAGYDYSLMLDEEGNVWVTGADYYFGRLGIGFNMVPTRINNMPPIKAIAAGYYHSLFLDNEGNVWATGRNKDGQLGLGDNLDRTISTKIEGMQPIKGVAAGIFHILFLDSDGNVWAIGNNEEGQLGLGNNVNTVQVPTKIEGMPTIQLPALERGKIPTKSARKIVE